MVFCAKTRTFLSSLHLNVPTQPGTEGFGAFPTAPRTQGVLDGLNAHEWPVQRRGAWPGKELVAGTAPPRRHKPAFCSHLTGLRPHFQPVPCPLSAHGSPWCCHLSPRRTRSSSRGAGVNPHFPSLCYADGETSTLCLFFSPRATDLLGTESNYVLSPGCVAEGLED